MSRRDKPTYEPIINRHVGQRLRLRRRRLGLSLMQLADALGISYQQLQKYETGLDSVPVNRLYDLARLLDVTIGYFFQGLHDEEILPPKRADKRFLPLARAFLRLNEEDQALLVRISRHFPDRRGPQAPRSSPVSPQLSD